MTDCICSDTKAWSNYNIKKEQRDRQERILELQRCIANKEESVKRRIERQKKNQEIAETAANESKDSTELKMRNYERNSIDEAFKQIKTHTGVTDVQAICIKIERQVVMTLKMPSI